MPRNIGKELPACLTLPWLLTAYDLPSRRRKCARDLGVPQRALNKQEFLSPEHLKLSTLAFVMDSQMPASFMTPESKYRRRLVFKPSLPPSRASMMCSRRRKFVSARRATVPGLAQRRRRQPFSSGALSESLMDSFSVVLSCCRCSPEVCWNRWWSVKSLVQASCPLTLSMRKVDPIWRSSFSTFVFRLILLLERRRAAKEARTTCPIIPKGIHTSSDIFCSCFASTNPAHCEDTR
mmetsp:Transcript_26897/g.37540  ORF Transcript_26897/g.37540 Transcript_26897/m.37540 type:complete len:236 (-) Transcript_26897:187-894(-)